jgi:hypothetical protein
LRRNTGLLDSAAMRRTAILLSVLVLALAFGTNQAATAAYHFARQFNVAEAGNQQGLAYGGGSLWACFDTGNGRGRIVRYSLAGSVQKRSPDLPLGHCAEIDYRAEDGTIYAVDYVPGGTTARVRVVDMTRPVPGVVKTFDIAAYGLGQMVAIDNTRDVMLIKGGSAPIRFNFFALSGTKSATTKTWLREVTYRTYLGTPQGLEVVGDNFLFLTSNMVNGSVAYNRVHTFAMNGAYRSAIQVPLARESEGLAVAPGTNLLYFGLIDPKAVYVMRPAYQP